MTKEATSKSTQKKERKESKLTYYCAKVSSYCPVLEGGANEYI